MRMTYKSRQVYRPVSFETVKTFFYPNWIDPLSPVLHDDQDRLLTFSYPAFVAGLEKITEDELGTHHKWKQIQHYKAEPETKPVGYDWEIADNYDYINSPASIGMIVSGLYFGYNPTYYGYPGLPFVGMPALQVDTSDDGFIPRPNQLNALNQRALSTMMPSIKAELSSINSIIELKDFVSLPKTISTVLKTTLLSSKLRNAAKSLKRPKGVAKLEKDRTLREWLRSSADGYLQAKFNILPLISDISGIFTALSRTERRINDLVARSGRVQNKHFTYNWPELTNGNDSHTHPIYGAWPYTSIMGNVDMDRTWVTEPSSFHAQIQYNYNYMGYQIAHARLLAFLDAFGVNLNPQIIWNAIPWSFVVDWVFDVSRFLKQFASLNMEPMINIHRYMWSIKRIRRTRITRQMPSYEYNGRKHPQTTRVVLPIIRETAYRRCVEMPEFSLIESSGVSLSEFTLGAALVLSRNRHHRSHGH